MVAPQHFDADPKAEVSHGDCRFCGKAIFETPANAIEAKIGPGFIMVMDAQFHPQCAEFIDLLQEIGLIDGFDV